MSRVYLLVLVEDAFDFFGDLMPRSATESSRALLSRRGPGRCRGSAADPRRRRHERPRPSEATATHAAIVKPGTPDRSRRRSASDLRHGWASNPRSPSRHRKARSTGAGSKNVVPLPGDRGFDPPPSTSGAALISNSFFVRCPRSRPRWRRHPCLNFAVSSTWSLRRLQSSSCPRGSP